VLDTHIMSLESRSLSTQSEFVCTDWSVGRSADEIFFRYELARPEGNTYNFVERICFPFDVIKRVPEEMIDSLHIALSISYFKLDPFSTFTHPYNMTTSQAEFWNEVFQSGLGEFLHENNLRSEVLPQFTSQHGIVRHSASDQRESKGVLLGIGGGKDSIVAAEILRSSGQEFSTFILSTGGQPNPIESVASKVGVKTLRCQRYIDPDLLDLNRQEWALNGHVPFSMILGFLGVIVASADGYSWFCVGNERSSELPAVQSKGCLVNHQWSKTERFERMFGAYLTASGSSAGYFSVVRSLDSVQICKMFAGFTCYFDVFFSDSGSMRIGTGSKAPMWGMDSAKTISTYLLLSAWLDEKVILNIFGYDVSAERGFVSTTESLLAHCSRPMDCVGTPSEIAYSICLAAESRTSSEWEAVHEMSKRVKHGYSHRAVDSMCFDMIPSQLRPTISKAITKLLNNG